MARRRATFEFDPARGRVDRGALVPLPEVPTLSWRGRPLLEPHHLRTPAQLPAVTKVVILGAAVSGVTAVDSYIQCCLLILLYGCECSVVGAVWKLCVRGCVWWGSGGLCACVCVFAGGTTSAASTAH